MSTPKVKQTNISYSSAGKHAVTGGNSFVAQRYNPMCPPSKRTGFVKINNSRRNTGYAYVPYSIAPDEDKIEGNASASAYSDFIHYNYGAVSERQSRPSLGKES